MKFAVFEFICNFSFGPLELLFLLQGGPWRKSGTEEGTGAAFPGEGFVGEKREETEAHLMVVLDGSGAAGRWVAGDVQGRRPWELGSGELG